MLLKKNNLGDYMDSDVVISILLLVVIMALLVLYSIFAIIEERRKLKKVKYYKTTIKFSCEYFKYIDMVKKMRKVILKKKIQLVFLEFLVFMKGILIWKK